MIVSVNFFVMVGQNELCDSSSAQPLDSLRLLMKKRVDLLRAIDAENINSAQPQRHKRVP